MKLCSLRSLKSVRSKDCSKFIDKNSSKKTCDACLIIFNQKVKLQQQQFKTERPRCATQTKCNDCLIFVDIDGQTNCSKCMETQRLREINREARRKEKGFKRCVLLYAGCYQNVPLNSESNVCDFCSEKIKKN